MPQSFHVLCCFKCKTFQVQQVKKVKKWVCKMCGEKQSVQRVFGEGSGLDCRRHVQKLNMMKGEKDQMTKDHLEQPEASDEYLYENRLEAELQPSSKQDITGSKWSVFAEEDIHAEDPNNQSSEQDMYTTNRAEFNSNFKQRRKDNKKSWSSTDPYNKRLIASDSHGVYSNSSSTFIHETMNNDSFNRIVNYATASRMDSNGTSAKDEFQGPNRDPGSNINILNKQAPLQSQYGLNTKLKESMQNQSCAPNKFAFKKRLLNNSNDTRMNDNNNKHMEDKLNKQQKYMQNRGIFFNKDYQETEKDTILNVKKDDEFHHSVSDNNVSVQNNGASTSKWTAFSSKADTNTSDDVKCDENIDQIVINFESSSKQTTAYSCPDPKRDNLFTNKKQKLEINRNERASKWSRFADFNSNETEDNDDDESDEKYNGGQILVEFDGFGNDQMITVNPVQYGAEICEGGF